MRFAPLLLVFCLWALPARSQTVLGKHPADQFLTAFFQQNGNANLLIQGLNTYGSLALNSTISGGGVTNIVLGATNGLSGGTLYLNTNFVTSAQIAALGSALTNLSTVVSNGVMAQIPSLSGYAQLTDVAATNTATLQLTTNLLGALGTASTNLSLAIGTAGTNNVNTTSNAIVVALIATNTANLQQTTNLVQGMGAALTNLSTVVSNGVMAQIPSLTGYAQLSDVAATNTTALQTTTNLLGALGTASTNLSTVVSNGVMAQVQALGAAATNLSTAVSNGVMGAVAGSTNGITGAAYLNPATIVTNNYAGNLTVYEAYRSSVLPYDPLEFMTAGDVTNRIANAIANISYSFTNVTYVAGVGKVTNVVSSLFDDDSSYLSPTNDRPIFNSSSVSVQGGLYLSSTNAGSYGLLTNVQNAIAGEVDLVVGGTAGTNTIMQTFATGNVTLTQSSALLTLSRIKADNAYFNIVSNAPTVIDFATTNLSEMWTTNASTTITGYTNIPNASGVYVKMLNLLSTNNCYVTWPQALTPNQTNGMNGTNYSIAFRAIVVLNQYTNVMAVPYQP